MPSTHQERVTRAVVLLDSACMYDEVFGRLDVSAELLDEATQLLEQPAEVPAS